MTITQAEIDDLRAQHYKKDTHPDCPVCRGRCYWCEEFWPCSTAKLLDDHKAQAERIETLEGALRTFVKWVDGLGDSDQVYVAEVLLKDAAAEARAALGETEEG